MGTASLRAGEGMLSWESLEVAFDRSLAEIVAQGQDCTFARD
jgi:hypothetical protein